MPFEVELLSVGLATVIDFVLLLVVLESGNRRLTAIWLKWALAGTTLWHAGAFAHTALYKTVGQTADRLDLAAMTVMVVGLLTITSGILHAAFRIRRSGPNVSPEFDRRYFLCYLPVLFSFVVVTRFIETGERSFVVGTKPFHGTYFLWLVVANSTCLWLFLTNRHRLSRRVSGARFLLRFSVGLVLVTVLTGVYLLRIHQSNSDPVVIRLLATLCPVVPALIFAYYIFRRRLIPLVFERTLVYAAIFLSVLYLHRLTVVPVMEKYEAKFRFDFVLLEGILLIALVLAYGPLRSRVNEGLRYLVGRDVARYRDQIKGLAVQVAARSSHSSSELLTWFAEELRRSLHLQFVEIRLEQPKKLQLRLTGVAAPDFDEREENVIDVERNRNRFLQGVRGWVDRSSCVDTGQRQLLDWLDLSAAYPLLDQTVKGCVLLGATESGDRLPAEQIQATSLLIDQLSSVLENQHLQKQKRSAERLAVQHEKLSTLGLLSGSIAHEVRNPLSSIRTIATLMKEDLDEADEHMRDLELIVSEIDRLTETTSQLLDFARPDTQINQTCCVKTVIDSILRILGHLARKHAVSLSSNSFADPLAVIASRASVTDIVLNLVKNAIEATRTSEVRSVQISSDVVSLVNLIDHRVPVGQDDVARCFVRVVITDTGPGILESNRLQMFSPFYTDKVDGTGLGLYLVAERLREIDGDVQCISNVGGGTEFRLLLPSVISSEKGTEA
ncbi:MAG: ATP-binding protein [Fuerstiella sp.]